MTAVREASMANKSKLRAYILFNNMSQSEITGSGLGSLKPWSQPHIKTPPIWPHCDTPRLFLEKLPLDKETDSVTSWQELATESMGKAGNWIKKAHRKEERETFGLDEWKDFLLLGFQLKRKVVYLLLGFSDLAGFHLSTWLLSFYW